MTSRPAPAHPNTAKKLGAYYTNGSVADFLVAWAVQSPHDQVLDPSFGEGVFLTAAASRLRSLGGDPSQQISGVELDQTAYSRALEKLRTLGVQEPRLYQRDFFELEPHSLAAEAVVGNPPYIRYQRFSGETRQLALKRSASQGVRLSELTSSWAPFLVHSISMVKPGGRLAVVIPFEIAYASYARPILAFLAESFGTVTFLTFREKLFPDLSENTLLLLADDKGSESARFAWRDLGSAADLADIEVETLHSNGGLSPLAHGPLCRGEERLVEYLLPPEVRRLYSRLKEHPNVHKLGEIANVGIGYVTGANDYFHLTPDEVQTWEIPNSLLKRAVCRGRVLSGLQLKETDWQQGLQTRDTAYLLHINGASHLPDGVMRYLESGERSGVSQKFKCRTRSPWYSVPHVYVPDAFLTYMSGFTPKLVANSAGVVAPNSLHIVRIKRGRPETGDQLSVLWNNSLTLLSSEIEGHALGGGLLKLEPGEARNVLLPTLIGPPTEIADLELQIDHLLRTGRVQGSTACADELVLKRGLGLSESDCNRLCDAVAQLMARRRQAGRRSDRAA